MAPHKAFAALSLHPPLSLVWFFARLPAGLAGVLAKRVLAGREASKLALVGPGSQQSRSRGTKIGSSPVQLPNAARTATPDPSDQQAPEPAAELGGKLGEEGLTGGSVSVSTTAAPAAPSLPTPAPEALWPAFPMHWPAPAAGFLGLAAPQLLHGPSSMPPNFSSCAKASSASATHTPTQAGAAAAPAFGALQVCFGSEARATGWDVSQTRTEGEVGRWGGNPICQAEQIVNRSMVVAWRGRRGAGPKKAV